MVENLIDFPHLKHKPENINIKHEKSLGFHDRMASLITAAIGTMYAVYLFAFIMITWVFWQLSSSKPFDPYPFAFLLFLGNIVQLLLMPLIMVGQNIQSRHSELRAEEEFKTTESIYQGMEKILQRLEEQEKEISRQSKLITELSEKLKK